MSVLVSVIRGSLWGVSGALVKAKFKHGGNAAQLWLAIAYRCVDLVVPSTPEWKRTRKSRWLMSQLFVSWLNCCYFTNPARKILRLNGR
ncbi:fluoride export protein 2-like [Senna tora]|uniref:Fluoride export protein 2-like n=1 Tax=Senna tora TaxID=362788 RepID=A0A834WRS3_9FABA|nr:fluoride export protein 2-like [Senna tora]